MSKHKSSITKCSNCGIPLANGRSMSGHLLSCQSILMTWDSFPKANLITNYMLHNKRVKNYSPITKDIIRRNNKIPSIQDNQMARSHTSSMPSLSQLATLITNAHSIEYVFPQT